MFLAENCRFCDTKENRFCRHDHNRWVIPGSVLSFLRGPRYDFRLQQPLLYKHVVGGELPKDAVVGRRQDF
jgi:hypothetical protein